MSALKFNDTDLQKKVTERFKIPDLIEVGKALYANKTPNVCSFNLRYYDRNAKVSRTIELGRFHPKTFNCDHARREARAKLVLVDQRKDLAKEKRVRDTVAHNGTKTFEHVAAAYIDYLKTPVVKQDGGTRPRKENWKVTLYSLARARALWATTQISDVHDTDISKHIKSVLEAEKLPEMARSIFAQLGAMFRWAGEPDQKYITANPMAFLKARKLGIPSPKPKKRVLTENEIRVLWHGLDDPNCPCDRRTALALKLILATALRPSEVGLMRREWIGSIAKVNGGDGLPAVRLPEWIVKLRRVIVQPLNGTALELVEEARSGSHLIGHNGGPSLDDDDGMLFPHGRLKAEFREYGTSIKLDAHALARALRSDKATGRVGICEFLGFTEEPVKGQNIEFSPFTPHDLRRTAASLLGFAEDTDGNTLYTEKEIDRILDHQTKDENSGNSSHETYNVAEHVNQTKRRRKTLDALDGLLRDIIKTKPKRKHTGINGAYR